ncbi:MAG: aerobic-type carbon monoxide dehydrogenase, small subunit CoxS/CutS-like protein [Actinomycetia bacterium]|nr:aerobic-type carbon monoxide dehydrogenase, small subunit CoxS/CutS-like protein [Actinomycetes bacterium]
MSDRVEAGETLSFTCNGESVTVAVAAGESLLSVLRERLGLRSAKDGCAPQGQCGCCTVWVDGSARVACVTPAARVAGRGVTTLEGLEPEVASAWSDALVATGGSQCGFCTPGIVMRLAAAGERPMDATATDRALAAHLCRCTGWQTIVEAIERRGSAVTSAPRRSLVDASRRAELEGGRPQIVDVRVPVGAAGFADDGAPAGSLVAIPLPPGCETESITAAGLEWIVAPSLFEARAVSAKVQGRRTTVAERAPIELPDLPAGGVRLATGWVEPAYLEPDASWCSPGAEPASPLANGGAFGGKAASTAPVAARELADRLGRTVRTVFSREDVVRLGPKRSPMAASAVLEGTNLRIRGRVAQPGLPAFVGPMACGYDLAVDAEWEGVHLAGPPTSTDLRAVGWAETAVLVEGAIDAAGVSRADVVRDERDRDVLLDSLVTAPGGARAGARVHIDPATGGCTGIEVRVAAGDPLDRVVLRSYAIGAAHMALGWVCTEGLAVDDDGVVHDLTIRSFQVLRAKDTPPIDVTIVEDPGPARPGGSDAVFAAVAAAAWNALARADGVRPEAFPARDTRTARSLRR